MNWVDRAAELKINEGKSWKETYRQLREEYDVPVKDASIRSAVRNHPKYKQQDNETIDIQEYLIKALEKEQSIDTLCDKLKITERVLNAHIEDIKEEGYLITEIDGKIKLCRDIVYRENHHNENWKGERILKFGSVSDPHLCSKHQQLTILNELYDIFVQEGINIVYQSGDLTEGFKMRPGHEHEIFRFGADEQCNYVIEQYPKRKGLVTKFITGNHDWSHIKNGGVDIGIRIAEKRPDMVYLGQGNAKVNITPNCIVELNHPLDGASYALSYAPQKTIDAMSGGEKPNILLNGHHHKAFYMMYRNVHAYECATTQAQTPWMRGKRIAANVGGWIIEVHVDMEGTITRCKGEYLAYYRTIENDY